jgi:regulator of sigma E protease
MIHESGHFFAAKLSKMRVEEFAFGFPPRIYGKKIGETTYALNSLPIGGYVKITGESFDPEEAKLLKNDVKAFQNRPRVLQVFVLVAGVFMNVLLAFVIFFVINNSNHLAQVDLANADNLVNKSIIITDVKKNSPAFTGGLKPGDTVDAVYANGVRASLSTSDSALSFIIANIEYPVTIVYKEKIGTDQKGKQKYDYSTTTIQGVYGIVEGRKSLGFSIAQVGYVKYTLKESFTSAAESTYTYTKLTILGLVDIVVKLVHGEGVSDNLAGPIGIAKMTGEASANGWQDLLLLVAVLSINLAVFNALPIPALDGGRILFVIYEAITRKNISSKIQYWANSVGFLLLIALMLFVTYKDVMR